MVEIIEVHGLYARSWKGVLNEASFVHPAKISFNLAEYIYRFAMERGMLEQDSTVLDPFGGICGTAFHAMVFGMNWYGVELEQKFVELGQANIEAWNKKYSATLPNWGSARLVQGDSRKLGEVLAEKCNGVISSPPYVSGGHHKDIMGAWNTNGRGQGVTKEDAGYGAAHGQLGNLPEGKLQETLDAAISSPPYAATMKTGSDKPRESDRQHRIDMGRDPDSPGSFNLHNYSQNEQNLGNLKEGSLDGVVSSPPYAAARIGETSGAEQVGHGTNYGGDVGQLGGMAEGNVDAVISSPPYAETPINQTHMTSNKRGDPNNPNYRPSWKTKLENGYAETERPYGETEGQLGGLKDEGFDAAIASPPYADQEKGYGDRPNRWEKVKDNPNFKGRTHWKENDRPNEYGATEGQLESLKDEGFTNAFDAALSSPPYEDNATRTNGTQGKGTYAGTDLSQGLNRLKDDYADMASLGHGDTFWSASKTIVSQVHQLLKPGGFAFFVVKNFVRKKAVVNFVGQWQQLCEACGFETLYEIRAWQVDEHGTQQGMEGKHKKLVTSRKSFFRRLHESHYPETAIDYEVVLVMRKVELPTLFNANQYRGALPEWGTPTKVEVI